MDEHVLRGNTAIIKCHIPSFVADYVLVSSWLEGDHKEIFQDASNYGTWFCFVYRFWSPHSILKTFFLCHDFSIFPPAA